ncbi:hypothetical protein EPN87_03250 [archaeon]|nr:MAG: hypothetical protein EPN87_03250 [archaeon]
MKAYHLKTSEPDPYGNPFESIDLVSLLIPSASILIGYTRDNRVSGRIFSYPYPSKFSKRAQAIVDGGKSVRGEVISTIELTQETVNEIRCNYNPTDIEEVLGYHSKDVKVTEPINEPILTATLVRILSGEIIEKESL